MSCASTIGGCGQCLCDLIDVQAKGWYSYGQLVSGSGPASGCIASAMASYYAPDWASVDFGFVQVNPFNESFGGGCSAQTPSVNGPTNPGLMVNEEMVCGTVNSCGPMVPSACIEWEAMQVQITGPSPPFCIDWPFVGGTAIVQYPGLDVGDTLIIDPVANGVTSWTGSTGDIMVCGYCSDESDPP